MTVIDWLSSDGRDSRKVIEYLAELIVVNRGDIQVRNIGQVVEDPSCPYGRYGLTPLEAMHLQELRGILSGFMMATGGAFEGEVRVLIQQTIARSSNVCLLRPT